LTLPHGRVLVTGASGFIGCRVCEHLALAHPGTKVRGTYHRPSRAARVARLDIELVRMDLASDASIDAAVAGCDAVVHCAYGIEGDDRTRRALTGSAAGRVAEAALRHGVRRFVHLSSVAVWGFDAGPGEIDEASPTRRTGNAYVDGKIDAEEVLDEVAARGLAVVVLRPANVYGPWSGLWTSGPVDALRAGRIALVGDGAAPANTTFVDNLVSAIVFGLRDEQAVGRKLVVVDEDGLSWRGLYEAYAALASPPLDVRSVSLEEWRRQSAKRGSLVAALAELRALLRSPEAAALARAAAARPALRRVTARTLRLVPGGTRRARRVIARPRPEVTDTAGDEMPGPELVAVQTAGAIFRARGLRSLGWTPPVSLAQALGLTAEWLRFARRL